MNGADAKKDSNSKKLRSKLFRFTVYFFFKFELIIYSLIFNLRKNGYLKLLISF